MWVSKVFGRTLRNVFVQCQNRCLSPTPHHHHYLPFASNQFHSLRASSIKACLLHDQLQSTSILQRLGISTSLSPQFSEKGTVQSVPEQVNTVEDKDAGVISDAAASDQVEEVAAGDAKTTERKQESSSSSETQSSTQSVKRQRRVHKRTAFSDSESEGDLDDLSKDDLVKLVMEKEEALKVKQKEIAAMQDKVLRSYADMENVMDRTRRDSENSKKFAIQSFAKSLLDVADNLGRASSVVKGSFAKIDASKDTIGVVPLLKTLLEGVEMTEKQLMEIFKKFGVEKYDPTNEQFDPTRHNAVFEVPDNTKPPGTVATVLKPGYMLHDRVIRPAEVGVTPAVEHNDTEASEA
ncbi:hypothetical protein Nepgr_026207 [Nepenthes gracilis]|uniref:GrpE protein homolog n=1 Tax=Nepenthes gracilis TaxID=150966 RepID=A0AAD3T8M6_NEPGR|nr:hypothetical protein Nepgr_026207 [Nepenthes gracilis]